MVKRGILLVTGAFWLTMMVLLWHSEYGRRGSYGSPVPVSLVWEKILTAPDASALQISHRGTNIGFCRWTAGVGQEVSADLSAGDELGPHGLPEEPASYRLDLEGHVHLAAYGTRLSSDLSLTLDHAQAWQGFHARFRLRPDVYEVEAVAAEKVVRVRANAGGSRYARTFKFSDLQNPQKLLREMGGPLLPGLVASLGVPASTNAQARLPLALHWEARQDWLQAGRTRLKVYRLETKLLDRYRIRVCVSPVGEILQVELPGDILLQHETLGNFPTTS